MARKSKKVVHKRTKKAAPRKAVKKSKKPYYKDSKRIDYINTKKRYSARSLWNVLTKGDKNPITPPEFDVKEKGKNKVIITHHQTKNSYEWDRKSGALKPTK